MSPTEQLIRNTDISGPRASGDEPVAAAFLYTETEWSPRERG